MSYRTEFPDFVLDVTIPTGFIDVSWHNDVCPSFEKDDGTFQTRVWIDYKNAVSRESSSNPRFSISMYENGDFVNDMMVTDDWNEIVAMLQTK